MKVIELKIPDYLNLNEFDCAMIVAAKLYADGKLSAGQAAELVGVSKETFLEILGKYGVSAFSTSVSNLHSDIENA